MNGFPTASLPVKKAGSNTVDNPCTASDPLKICKNLSNQKGPLLSPDGHRIWSCVTWFLSFCRLKPRPSRPDGVRRGRTRQPLHPEGAGEAERRRMPLQGMEWAARKAPKKAVMVRRHFPAWEKSARHRAKDHQAIKRRSPAIRAQRGI